jgi:hypothetical protein
MKTKTRLIWRAWAGLFLISASAANAKTAITDNIVPDGAVTAAMAGIALLGLLGLRSKFGDKRP